MKDDLVDALVKEMANKRNFFPAPVETIYFGGGTPSLLDAEELEKIFSAISKYFTLAPSPEITLEANPDDLDPGKLAMLKKTGVNRLSIGIQTFDNGLLRFLNRIHSADEAIKSYKDARKAGFENINCDLIFAIPGQDNRMLEKDLRIMNDLKPEHISAYCLTVEEKTVFGNWLKKNRFREVDEEQATEQMLAVWDLLSNEGYEQYEISNFCRDGHYSKHNRSYWQDKIYLGIGPGAHSYDGKDRFFNIGNNSLYIKAIRQGQLPITMEGLTLEDRINEYILTSLRTQWGCDPEYFERNFGFSLLQNKRETIERFISEGFICPENGRLVLAKKGKIIADHISSKLFVEKF